MEMNQDARNILERLQKSETTIVGLCAKDFTIDHVWFGTILDAMIASDKNYIDSPICPPINPITGDWGDVSGWGEKLFSYFNGREMRRATAQRSVANLSHDSSPICTLRS